MSMSVQKSLLDLFSIEILCCMFVHILTKKRIPIPIRLNIRVNVRCKNKILFYVSKNT